MPKGVKNIQRKAATPRNTSAAAPNSSGKSAAGTVKASAVTKKQPLKPRNNDRNIVVREDAAALFAAIAKRKSEAAKDQEAVDDDSASEQLNTFSSDDERVVKKVKLESANLLEIEATHEVPSSASSKTSLSTSLRNDEIMNMLKIINDKVDNIEKRQEKCLILTAQVNAKIDRLTSRSEQRQSSNASEKTADIKLIPVNSLADLEAAEEQCEDQNYVNNVIREMGKIHGNNRFKNKGGTVCHQMIDFFVDRRFFRLCSWTGISKTLDENNEVVPKIPFSRYEKYINLFYKVICNSDSTFTKDECHKFLKQCLRNSKQRANELLLRQPASRNRSKKLLDVSGPSDGEIVDHGQNSKSITEFIEESIEQDQECSKIEYIEQVNDNEQDYSEDLNGMIIEEVVLRGMTN